MDIATLAGGNSLTMLSLCIAGTIVTGLWVVTFFGILYHNFFYPKIMKVSYSNSYNPSCSIILPCKGLPKNFKENIQSFLDLDYDNYEIIYTVESPQDQAVPIIQKVIKNDSRASLVIAGITTSCSQKNFNMIAALEKTHNPEIFVFADSDIKPHSNWLNELIKPLSNTKISVTTGFRWLYSSTGKIGEIANAYQNSLLFILFSFSSFTQNIGLWGGSMAIKRKDFESMGVKGYWAQTVVDDMSLSKLVMKNSKKSVMVSTCVTPTNDALQSIGQSIKWFERQVMFLKAYHTSLWYIAIAIVTSCLIIQILLPLSMGIAYFTNHTFFGMGGASSVIFTIGTMSTALAYPFLGKHPTLFRFLIYQPLSLFTMFLGVLRTVFTNRVTWSGFIYKLNYKGIVISVEQQ